VRRASTVGAMTGVKS